MRIYTQIRYSDVCNVTLNKNNNKYIEYKKFVYLKSNNNLTNNKQKHMDTFINYYGQELHVGDYLYNFGGYGIVKIENIQSPDIAQGNADGSFRIWFWCGYMDKHPDGTLHKHIRGVKGNDNNHLYKIEPNEEIERMFSINPTDANDENIKFNKIRNKYCGIYEKKIKESCKKKKLD